MKPLEAAARGVKGAMVNRSLNPEFAAEFAYSAVVAFLRAAMADYGTYMAVGIIASPPGTCSSYQHGVGKSAIQALIDSIE